MQHILSDEEYNDYIKSKGSAYTNKYYNEGYTDAKKEVERNLLCYFVTKGGTEEGLSIFNELLEAAGVKGSLSYEERFYLNHYCQEALNPGFTPYSSTLQ